jgi:hypothetical protein
MTVMHRLCLGHRLGTPYKDRLTGDDQMDDRKRSGVPQEQVRATFIGGECIWQIMAEKLGRKYVERPPIPAR